MKLGILKLSLTFFIFPMPAFSQEWKLDCVGYYNLQLPDNIDMALYPINDLISPRKAPVSDGGILVRRYESTGFTFNKNHYRNDKEAGQAQFTQYYYSDYKVGVSSKGDKQFSLTDYISSEKDRLDFGTKVKRQYEQRKLKLFGEPLTSKDDFDRQNKYLVRVYPSASAIYKRRGYTIYYLNGNGRLYHFWSETQKKEEDQLQTAEKQIKKNELLVISLLNRFRERELYEVPSEQGFCLPYGFIVNDGGDKKRNMTVTYRLKDHPDITIFFQDLGMEPGAGFQRPENESAKDFVL
ncbi:MAG: hypothetical protein XXXJIFNMEKO3_02649 [Candidatus Erwinia impunctatus]|nr:hypothetical protein XXXJIFNMEKO_02649 [Culicoides impunctatus]